MRQAIKVYLSCMVFGFAGSLGSASAGSEFSPPWQGTYLFAPGKLMTDTRPSSNYLLLVQAQTDKSGVSDAPADGTGFIIVPYDPLKAVPRPPLPNLLSGPPWPDCITLSELSPEMSPVQVVEVTIACAQSGDYETMATIRYFEYVLSWFDTERLGTRGRFTPDMSRFRRQHVTVEQRQNATPYLDRIREEKIAREAAFYEGFCGQLRAHGTPTYDADWAQPLLEHHGISADPPENTSDDELWDYVLERYIGCTPRQ
ncbi:hypothetical protein MWU60_18985 [Yoonia sp. F2084L]|uniref:hypothetical protein n=1 Tax=Yoonia sp. F2084L TaxID=2926419 RepID=UPI001FF432E2|nr:hypothetical protein [Yoonia sp. F2084L]MCK0097666.1 hypothetical protein [Yoonia sp. F2084L]